jgi:hypothetical protein
MIFVLVGFTFLAMVDLNVNSGARYLLTYLMETEIFTSGVLSFLGEAAISQTHHEGNSLRSALCVYKPRRCHSSLTFRTQDALFYRLALTVTGSFQAALVVAGLAMRQYYIQE